ncbi:DUF4179 domain-containing protein [Litchfieldia alkalitelluris]|uniref:DUF4179 domain-containing protein n=1 Tax=Litchfieldia alkalitelluris TaxID=304268 RepID=UPI00099783EF|nr:DUF4179 domain-containing protein [Litchfieldia alkalitelluris]
MDVVATNPTLGNAEDMETILDWFDQKKERLYKLGQTYLRDSQNLEEAFFRAVIRVHDEKQELKNHRFELFVLSIFISECREISRDEQVNSLNEINKEASLLDKLYYLEEIYKEPLVLTYLMEIPQNEVAKLLQIPIQVVKSRLLTGIRQLKTTEENKDPKGCQKYQDYYLDYLGLLLTRRENIELEIHLHTCKSCQNELAFIQDTIISLSSDVVFFEIPSTFMSHVKTKVNEIVTMRKLARKKRTRIGTIIASILVLSILIGFVTNGFSYMYYSWMDWRQLEDEQLLSYLKNGVGEPLYLEQESNGLKVTIKSVIADDYRTLIYYSVEDLNNENQYFINGYDGFRIENENEILNHQAYHMDSLPFEYTEHKEKAGNVFNGKISLLPISPESGTIELNISSLLKVVTGQSSLEETFIQTYNKLETVSGEWSFEIPVTKIPSIEHELDKESEFAGIPVKFKKLTLAPTTTILHFSYKDLQNGKYINDFNFNKIETEKNSVESNWYGAFHGNVIGSGEWISLQKSFDSLYFDDPQDLTIHLNSIDLHVQDDKTFDIDPEGAFPQTFEYLGNEISVDNLEVGKTTSIDFLNTLPENRGFDMLHFQIFTDDPGDPISMNFMDSEGVYIDKNGKVYKQEEYNFSPWDRPRFYTTKMEIQLFNDYSDEDVVPTKLQIYGYNTLKYLDKKVKLTIN